MRMKIHPKVFGRNGVSSNRSLDDSPAKVDKLWRSSSVFEE
jgi:hypothetical protein